MDLGTSQCSHCLTGLFPSSTEEQRSQDLILGCTWMAASPWGAPAPLTLLMAPLLKHNSATSHNTSRTLLWPWEDPRALPRIFLKRQSQTKVRKTTLSCLDSQVPTATDNDSILISSGNYQISSPNKLGGSPPSDSDG